MSNRVTYNNEAVERLSTWIQSLIEDAEKDVSFSVAWFKDTENEPFSIVGGWLRGFSEEYSDLLYTSKSNPDYAMCVKVISNEGPYTYADFESLDMPIDRFGEVDDTCVALERNDDPMLSAAFFLSEWDRITKEHEENENDEL